MKTNGKAQTQPISARVSAEVYRLAFDLCAERDCTVSELLSRLLETAIESGEAEKIVSEVEGIKAKNLQSLNRRELSNRLRDLERQSALIRAALNGLTE